MVCGIRRADVCTSRLLFFCVSFVWFVSFLVQQNRSVWGGQECPRSCDFTFFLCVLLRPNEFRLMNADEFESRLQQTPLRPPPIQWREDILAATRTTGVTHADPRTAPVREPRFAATWQGRLRELFWPHPVAWGVIAAIWIAIGTVHLALKEPGRPAAPHYLAIDSDLPTPMTLQRELLAWGDEPADTTRPAPIRPIPPQSSIERRRETSAA